MRRLLLIASSLLLLIFMPACRRDDEKEQKQPPPAKTDTTKSDNGAVQPAAKPFPPLPKKNPEKHYRDTYVEKKGTTPAGVPNTPWPNGMSVATGVEFYTTNPDGSERRPPEDEMTPTGIAFDAGTMCAEPAWLQFLWKTRYYGDDPSKLEKGTFGFGRHNPDGTSEDAPREEVSYTTDPADPSKRTIRVDSAATDSPYYNTEAAHKDKQMFDRPSKSRVPEGDPNKGKKETMTVHYTTYLVCDGKIVFRIQWTATFIRQAGKRAFSDPDYQIESAGASGTLSPEESAELKKEYPSFQ